MENNSKLNEVLTSFLNTSKTDSDNRRVIHNRFKDNYSDKEIDLILDKLYKDSYINIIEPRYTTFKMPRALAVKESDWLYHITFDGIQFIQKGGYGEKVKKDYWKYIAGGVGILAFVYTVFSSERIYTKDKEINELKGIINLERESHKSFVDSIHSRSTSDNNLTDSINSHSIIIAL